MDRWRVKINETADDVAIYDAAGDVVVNFVGFNQDKSFQERLDIAKFIVTVANHSFNLQDAIRKSLEEPNIRGQWTDSGKFITGDLV